MIYCINRHECVLDWMRNRGIVVDKLIRYFDASIVKKGDIVIGNLPINIIGDVCNRGGRFFHFSYSVDGNKRDLTVDDLNKSKAYLKEYMVTSK